MKSKKIFLAMVLSFAFVMMLTFSSLAREYYYEDEDGNTIIYDTKGSYTVIDEDGNYVTVDKRGNYIVGDSDGNYYFEDRKGNGYYYDADNDGRLEYYYYHQIPSRKYYSQGIINGDVNGGPGVVNPNNGSWEHIGNGWAYKVNGNYVVNAWREISGKWYYFNELGFMVTGWKTINGKTYFFTSLGDMVTGTQSIDGALRVFGPDGALIG